MLSRRFTTIARFQPGMPFVEAYGQLLVGLVLGQNGHPVRTVVVTSALEGAGATTTAINLSMMIARQGRKTLIVDANLRNPALHSAFRVEQAPGMADALIGQVPIGDLTRPTGIPSLDVLTSGNPTLPPHALVEPQRLGVVTLSLSAGYEFVVFDTPPVLKFPDALNVGPMVDGVLLVVPAEADPSVCREAHRRLERVHARILGAVLNRVSPQIAMAVSE
jgi:protein-tyrosine kinase